MTLTKIISGAQTGADLAGLDTAQRFGLQTGGWMTKGCRTLDGPRFNYKAKYGLKERDSFYYKDRTWANINDSDGTIRFAHNFYSAGEICTLNGVKNYNKPSIDVDLRNPRPTTDVVNWIVENNIVILNVAGNSEQSAAGIYREVCIYLGNVFGLLGLKEKLENS